MAGKTPNYALMVDYEYRTGSNWDDRRTVPAGSFVRPLELQYVPKHVVDNPLYKDFNKDKQVFCYCKWGIIPIPKEKIREV